MTQATSSSGRQDGLYRVSDSASGQCAGHDYDKTFVSVANVVSVRVLLDIVCELYCEVHQIDVKAAY